MKILMFGQTGQVATEILRRAGNIEVEALNRAAADQTDPAACAALVRTTNADIIINAAAYTAVDKAEDDEATAAIGNGETPTAIAYAAAARNIPFLHISTDYVFDGTGEAPWIEEDKTAPIGAYGWTKLAGEGGVAAAGGPFAILRTSWVFSAHGANFVKTMLRLGADRDALTIVDDQIGGPTAAADIADVLLTMAKAFHAGKGTSGIYHFAGAPSVSWRQFAEAIFAKAGQTVAVTPIPTSDYPTPAARPLNSRLTCAKIKADYGIDQPDWRTSLNDVIGELT
ncbi:MAG: dTDP-4-dehydrorhamnose reductase [Paracoccaceae bacterium]|nr:dTDP-4-dehydrorhamnose reductase [Paracoccaceae bacterium]